MVDFREHLILDHDERSRYIFDSLMATVWTALPGIIESYDPVAITVKVRPSVQGIVRDHNGVYSNVTMPLLPDVPVVFQRGGGFTMTLPIKPGDECLVVFSSRCIDGWWESAQIAPQFEKRMHDLSDGFALIGPFSRPKAIKNVSTTNVQLRADDGSVYVDLALDGTITLVAPRAVVVDAPITEFSGNVIVAGDVTSNGGAVSLNTHVHTRVQGGTGNSGPPLGG